ncbi:MAG: hypothetical protein ACO3RQ_09090 [Litorivicinaceae bacterium]|jgi:hypothetical protein
MSYVVISNWSNDQDGKEAAYALAQSKFAPMLKGLGAIQAYFVATSDTTFSVITVYPDEATAASAKEKQDAVRAQAASDLPVKLLGESRGDVFAGI